MTIINTPAVSLTIYVISGCNENLSFCFSLLGNNCKGGIINGLNISAIDKDPGYWSIPVQDESPRLLFYCVGNDEGQRQVYRHLSLVSKFFPASGIIVSSARFRLFLFRAIQAKKVSGYLLSGDKADDKRRVAGEVLSGHTAVSFGAMTQYLKKMHGVNAMRAPKHA